MRPTTPAEAMLASHELLHQLPGGRRYAVVNVLELGDQSLAYQAREKKQLLLVWLGWWCGC